MDLNSVVTEGVYWREREREGEEKRERQRV